MDLKFELIVLLLLVIIGCDSYFVTSHKLKKTVKVNSYRYIQSVLGTIVTIKPGRHVCTTEKVISKPVKVTQVYKKPVYTSHPRDCTDFNNCPQFDVKYEDTNRTVFLLQKSSSFRHSCCPGWTKGFKREKGCMAPICTNGCGDFGICIKPEVCECPKGYQGEFCDRDVDECQSKDHGCQQICKNTAGSFMCACHTGFSLSEDGKTCNYCYKCQKEYTDLVMSVENIEKSLSGGVIIQEDQMESLNTQQNIILDKMLTLELEIRNLTKENKRLETDLLSINDKFEAANQEIEHLQNLTRSTESELINMHDKFESANQEIERLQNITRTTEAPPTTTTTTQSTPSTTSTNQSTTSSTSTTPRTTPTTTTTTTSATTTTTEAETTPSYQDQGLNFGVEDMLYSLSNQIGMMEEKLDLCNCHARRRP